MSAIREIKDRMTGIQSTMKITKAMYMISSTKMNKAKQSLANTEPYFYSLQKVMLTILQSMPDNFHHPYLDERKYINQDNQRRAVICVTGDKGLAGAYNHNVLKMTEQMLKGFKSYKLYMVGEVGRQYFIRRHIPIEESFLYTAQNPTLPTARSIASKMLELFENQKIDELYIVYTRMENATQFVPDIDQLLPLYRLNRDVEVGGDTTMHYQLEPNPKVVLNTVIPDYLAGYIYSCLVESYAAEHFARMQAMDSANKNGEDLLAQLSLQYNRQRQAQITQEITEVAAGAKARKQQLEKKRRRTTCK
ncbi:ATP synthase F1 subunit gamma [Absicoccus porci]|uniref:ATP synthase F1 subunit gamma n=1 Tax=Absicoccus porci TaxID=2486576 RepID=UPI002A81D817|nr:ATP synthase F1 subunit gamma [Absicoccus porci]MDY4738015.1 ATP synthase F1 subunit gamma [Absicoccus porci]